MSGLLTALNIGIFIFSVLLLAQSWPYRRLAAIRYLILVMIAFCLGSFFTLNVYTATSIEAKTLFSQLRFLGFSILAPSGLLFFSHILRRWTWIQKPWVQTIIFAPAVGTIIITLFFPNLVIRGHAPFEYWGVSVLTFENGPWFPIHYIWSNLLTSFVLIMFIQTAISDSKKRGAILIFSTGILIGSIIDGYCVTTKSPLRWLMLSAGTFAITEFTIWYVSRKNDLFGVLTSEKRERAKLHESLAFQKRILELLAHDLSGNITQQAHLAQFLRRRIQDNHHEILNTWSESAQASSDLINNIMKWAKSQGEDFKPQLRPVDISNLIQDCINTVQSAFSDRKVRIEVEAPASPSCVSCDPEMMASILRNLLSNAIKATKDNTQITVRVSEKSDRTDYSVQDEGHGMSTEQIQSLLQNKGVKTGGAGYGFGLILVRHFVEKHQGTLEIDSVPTKGTRISFSIPT